MKEAKYYRIINQKEKKLQCNLCPHNCLLEENQTGKCLVRKNINAKLYCLTYNLVSSIAIDPIEKKPLYHFYPGKKILSIGSYGCNFKCGFCQNWEISQTSLEENFIQKISSKQLLEIAKRYKDNIGISYTYNEPLINFEFVLETAKIFHQEGYKNVLVTNGFINKEPLLELIHYIDAANIDLKSFNPNFYKQICDGNLNFVLQTIELMFKEKKHIEITTLVIPKNNDSEKEIVDIINYVSNLSKEIPLHFSRYYPMYKFKEETTPIETLLRCYNLAKQKLYNVYLGNILDEKYNSTYCPKCGSILIQRKGYTVNFLNLKNNECKNCKEKIKIVI